MDYRCHWKTEDTELWLACSDLTGYDDQQMGIREAARRQRQYVSEADQNNVKDCIL